MSSGKLFVVESSLGRFAGALVASVMIAFLFTLPGRCALERWQALRRQALREYARSDFKAARADLKKALPMVEGKSKDDTAMIYSDLGSVYRASKDWNAAESCYKKAVALSESKRPCTLLPDYSAVLRKLGKEKEAMNIDEKHNAERKPEDSIGVCWMEDDGTIVLRLTATGPGGMVGDGQLSYPPGHAQYDEILEHVGPLKPGEHKPVAPWTD